MGGLWQLSETATGGTHIHFENEGRLILPVPRLMRVVVKPIATQRFMDILDVYIENLKETMATF